MEDFLKAIANYGFPIVVAAYLLLRMEKTINDLVAEIVCIKEKINEIYQRLE
jgi:hypothetical protein